MIRNLSVIFFPCTEIDVLARVQSKTRRRLKLRCSSSAVGMWSWDSERRWDTHYRQKSWTIFNVICWTILSVSAVVLPLVRHHATEVALSSIQIHRWWLLHTACFTPIHSSHWSMSYASRESQVSNPMLHQVSDKMICFEFYYGTVIIALLIFKSNQYKACLCTYQIVDPVPFTQTLPGPTPQPILKSVDPVPPMYPASPTPLLNKVLSPLQQLISFSCMV